MKGLPYLLSKVVQTYTIRQNKQSSIIFLEMYIGYKLHIKSAMFRQFPASKTQSLEVRFNLMSLRGPIIFFVAVVGIF